MRIATGVPGFQGDLMVRRITSLPNGVVEKTLGNDELVHILAHSETGHHHVVEAAGATRFIDQTNAFITYLKIASDTELKHLRDYDTHESILLQPGVYEIRQQREYVAEGFRRVAD